MAAHLDIDPERELIDLGHVEENDSASWALALRRLHELDGDELEPHVTQDCSEHTDDYGPACVWNNADDMYAALYDLNPRAPRAGKRRAHVLEGASA